MISDVTGVLLAGGKSRRMGEDKRFLDVGGKTIFDRSLTALRVTFKHVLVVIAQDSPSLRADVPVLRDLVADCGSLGGIYTGLQQAVTEHIFVVACDMPFLNSQAIRYVAGMKEGADIVMVQGAQGLQPTHAVYSWRCIPFIKEMIRTQQLKIQSLLAHSSLRVKRISEDEFRQVDPDGRSLMNVNTPSDLETARKIVADSTVPPAAE
jgi:molybdenum cofactor guanylyltransferase